MEGYTVEEVSNRHGEAPPLIRVTRHSNGDVDTFGADDFWNFYEVAAIFLLPRLVALKDENRCYAPYGVPWEAWSRYLDTMIYAFEVIVDDFNEVDDKAHYDEKVQEGLTLFGRYFLNLSS